MALELLDSDQPRSAIFLLGNDLTRYDLVWKLHNMGISNIKG